VLGSQEVHDIAVAVGVEPGSEDLSQLRFGKVCILADADSDGAHIATLLCALFLKHFPGLVAQGHVHVAMPPLFRIDVGKQVYYALDEAERQGILDRIAAERLKGKVSIQRFKGLGEMNPQQLRETTMHPDTRRLIQLTVQDGDDTHACWTCCWRRNAPSTGACGCRRRGTSPTCSHAVPGAAPSRLKPLLLLRCDHLVGARLLRRRRLRRLLGVGLRGRGLSLVASSSFSLPFLRSSAT